jgi:hypothetical protein
MKALEETVEQTLLREEQALEAEEAASNGPTDDVSTLQKNMRDMKTKHEVSSPDVRSFDKTDQWTGGT